MQQCSQCGHYVPDDEFDDDVAMCEDCAPHFRRDHDDADPWAECETCGEGYHNPEDLSACNACGAYPLVND